MAKRKIQQAAAQQQEPDLAVDVQEVRESALDFWEKYGKLISLVGGGALLIFGGYFLYKYMVKEPAQKAAVEAMSQAQLQFERDSFQLALENPGGGAMGFQQIIDEYGSSEAGNTAKYYAGVCHLHLGQYDQAIEKLESFSPSGALLPIMKQGVLGDAYSEKSDFGAALKHYEKAVSAGDNDVLTPYYLKKVGQLAEKQGDWAAAKKAYEQIKSKYPASPVAADIDRYLVRASR